MESDRKPYYPPASKAWFLLPIFLGIIGGAIAWAAVRGRNPPRARKMLVLGAIITALFFGVLAYFVYTVETIIPDVPSST